MVHLIPGIIFWSTDLIRWYGFYPLYLSIPSATLQKCHSVFWTEKSLIHAREFGRSDFALARPYSDPNRLRGKTQWRFSNAGRPLHPHRSWKLEIHANADCYWMPEHAKRSRFACPVQMVCGHRPKAICAWHTSFDLCVMSRNSA